MTDPAPSFSARLALAFATFFRLLGDAVFAGRVLRLSAPEPPEALATTLPAPAPAKVTEAIVKGTDERAALQLLALFQREGRFVDFLEEDIGGFSDAQIGAAARAVHEGCKKVVREHLPVAPIRSEDEGAKVTLAPGFDAAANRLTGQVRGEPPFTGTLQHRGYRVTDVRLPKLHDAHDARIIAPAEIEL